MKPISIIKSTLKEHIVAEGEDGFSAMFRTQGIVYSVVASWGGGWEHVSIAVRRTKERCPTWEEMCMFKDMFWQPNETVIQYHPAYDDYVNNLGSCLHLWRPINQEIPTPPISFV